MRGRGVESVEDTFLLSEYNKGTAKKEWTENPFPVTGTIDIENIEEKQIVYVRHTGTYETLEREFSRLLKQLFDHAKKQHLLADGQNWILAMYHDNPEFGEENQFRTSLCLTVPMGVKIREDGILGRMTLEGGVYAVGHFRIKKEQYPDAWNYMYQEWITGSGYVPGNNVPFEVYRNDPATSENQISEVDLYVPIEPIHF